MAKMAGREKIFFTFGNVTFYWNMNNKVMTCNDNRNDCRFNFSEAENVIFPRESFFAAILS